MVVFHLFINLRNHEEVFDFVIFLCFDVNAYYDNNVGVIILSFVFDISVIRSMTYNSSLVLFYIRLGLTLHVIKSV